MRFLVFDFAVYVYAYARARPCPVLTSLYDATILRYAGRAYVATILRYADRVYVATILRYAHRVYDATILRYADSVYDATILRYADCVYDATLLRYADTVWSYQVSIQLLAPPTPGQAHTLPLLLYAAPVCCYCKLLLYAAAVCAICLRECGVYKVMLTESLAHTVAAYSSSIPYCDSSSAIQQQHTVAAYSSSIPSSFTPPMMPAFPCAPPRNQLHCIHLTCLFSAICTRNACSFL
eukprot:623062-Rhodomonas_salina.1